MPFALIFYSRNICTNVIVKTLEKAEHKATFDCIAVLTGNSGTAEIIRVFPNKPEN